MPVAPKIPSMAAFQPSSKVVAANVSVTTPMVVFTTRLSWATTLPIISGSEPMTASTTAWARVTTPLRT